MGSNIEVEIEMKTPAEKLWNDLKQFATLIPKAMPEAYEKIDVVEGDGKSVGSVVMSTYKPEINLSITTSKERIVLVDDEKKILSLEGEVLNCYKNFNAVMRVSSTSDGSLLKYSAEFVMVNAQVPAPDVFKDFIIKLFQSVDAYLLYSTLIRY